VVEWWSGGVWSGGSGGVVCQEEQHVKKAKYSNTAQIWASGNLSIWASWAN
jgi:hypothetical protein